MSVRSRADGVRRLGAERRRDDAWRSTPGRASLRAATAAAALASLALLGAPALAEAPDAAARSPAPPVLSDPALDDPARAEAAQEGAAPEWARFRGGPTRIVGGEIADPSHWPGFAALRQASLDGDVVNYFCGGVAITSRWVLTAAHCLAEHANGPVADDVAMPGGERRRARLQVALGADDLSDLIPREALTRNLGRAEPAPAPPSAPDSLIAAATPLIGFGLGGAPSGEAASTPAAVAVEPPAQDPIPTDPAVFEVERIVLHPDYAVALDAVPSRFGRRERQALEAMLPVVTGRDIALVKLARPWTGATMPLSLDPADDPGPGAPVRVAGFGATERRNFRPEARMLTEPGARPTVFAPSSVLREAGLPIMSLAACRTGYTDIGGARIGASELCAGFEEGGKAACSGDSGGPLISLGDDGPTMIGLVSWGPTDPQSCGRPGRGVVYTRVSRYADWIRDVIAEDESASAEAVAQGAPPEPADILRRIDLKAFVRQLGDLLGGAAQRNLSLTIDRGNRLPVGAETSFTFVSERAGYPVLLDVDADRRLSVILPTGSVRARDLPRAPAGEPFVIPLAIDRITSYEVTPPLGRGLLIGLIAPSRADVAALTVLDGMRTRDVSVSRAPALALMRLLRSIEAAVQTDAALQSAPELGAPELGAAGSGAPELGASELGAPELGATDADGSDAAPAQGGSETTLSAAAAPSSAAPAPSGPSGPAAGSGAASTGPPEARENWGVAIVEYEIVAPR